MNEKAEVMDETGGNTSRATSCGGNAGRACTLRRLSHAVGRCILWNVFPLLSRFYETTSTQVEEKQARAKAGRRPFPLGHRVLHLAFLLAPGGEG